jgi:Flp pilus assembly pilin Flp
MKRLLIRLHCWIFVGNDRGQATTEYALVLLGAAVVALLVVAWATSGGGAGKIGHLFDRVIDAVDSKL